MKKMTLKQVHRKYKGKYIEFSQCPKWDTNGKGEQLYEVYRAYEDIHENTTLGEDVGTSYEYCR